MCPVPRMVEWGTVTRAGSKSALPAWLGPHQASDPARQHSPRMSVHALGRYQDGENSALVLKGLNERENQENRIPLAPTHTCSHRIFGFLQRPLCQAILAAPKNGGDLPVVED